MSLNKVMLIGNLGRDPELRHTSNGTAVCDFTMATNETWRDKNNETQTRTEWHRIVVWGRQGENVSKYLRKGRQAFVEGRLQTREWQDRDGNKRTTTEIIATNVVFLKGGGDDGGRGNDGPPPPNEYDGPPSGGGRGNSGGGNSGGGGGDGFSDDEIPF